ncbi:MAG: hypothetical protein WC676_07590 [Candidatus Omnitrophota bacterium]
MAEEKKEAKQEVKVVEAVKNCTGCNKPMKKVKRYYRNGKYYCNKRCFKNANTKDSAKESDKE